VTFLCPLGRQVFGSNVLASTMREPPLHRGVAVDMGSPEGFRDKADQARRLARLMTVKDVIETLEQLALEYEKIADDLEKGAASRAND
jgi:hypothetical protein